MSTHILAASVVMIGVSTTLIGLVRVAKGHMGASRVELRTLRDAGEYIARLPKRQHDTPEWQAAIEALMLVVERDGPTMLARIGIMRALNRHVERVYDPERKNHHRGKRKLARDR